MFKLGLFLKRSRLVLSKSIGSPYRCKQLLISPFASRLMLREWPQNTCGNFLVSFTRANVQPWKAVLCEGNRKKTTSSKLNSLAVFRMFFEAGCNLFISPLFCVKIIHHDSGHTLDIGLMESHFNKIKKNGFDLLCSLPGIKIIRDHKSKEGNSRQSSPLSVFRVYKIPIKSHLVIGYAGIFTNNSNFFTGALTRFAC